MGKPTGIGRIGKTYRSGAWTNAEGVRRFEREVTDPRARELGAQLAGALILVMVLLGVIGWAFTL